MVTCYRYLFVLYQWISKFLCDSFLSSWFLNFSHFCVKENTFFIVTSFERIRLCFRPLSFINNFLNLPKIIWLFLLNIVKSCFFIHHFNNLFPFEHVNILEIICSFNTVSFQFSLIKLVCFSWRVSTLTIVCYWLH